MSILDVFKTDAFSPVTMAEVLDDHPFKPTFLGERGIFTHSPIRTETFTVEHREGTLKLLQTSERGEPSQTLRVNKADIRAYSTSRISQKTRIMASELAFTRSFGAEQRVKSLQEEIIRRLGGTAVGATGGSGLLDNVDYTLEHMRLGAIQGVVSDADGSIIMDWKTEFNHIPLQPDEVFNFATMDRGDFYVKLKKIRRQTKKNARGAWVHGSRVECLVGDEAWDEMMKLAEIVELSLNKNDNAKFVRNSDIYDTFEYGGVIFHNYESSDDGVEVAIGTKDFRFFPTGTAGAFLEVFSHGESFDHINTLGKRVYPSVNVDRENNEWVDLRARSYPMHVLSRPSMIKYCHLPI